MSDSMVRLQAEEQQQAMVAASTPHMKPQARDRLLRKLQVLAGAPQPKPEPMAVETYDPEQASAWFAALGAQVN